MFAPPPGCCCSLHARPRKNWNHAGLLPREKTENIWDRSHQPDPHTATRLNRNSWSGKGSHAVLSALTLAVYGLHLKIISGLLIILLLKFIFYLKIQNNCILSQCKRVWRTQVSIVDFIQYMHSTSLLEVVLFVYALSQKRMNARHPPVFLMNKYLSIYAYNLWMQE